jgi:hypothetical protein
MSIESVLSHHLPYVTIFHCSLGRSHKADISSASKNTSTATSSTSIKALFFYFDLYVSKWNIG